MRRSGWLLSVIVLLWVAPAAGQELVVGWNGGVTLATQERPSIVSDASRSRREGLHTGVTLGVRWNRYFDLELGILYAQRGIEQDFDVVVATTLGISQVSVAAEHRMNYLEMPLLGRFTIPTGEFPVRPTVVAGPAFAFELSCAFGEAVGGDEPTFRDCDDATDNIDFGAVVGVGALIDLGQVDVGLEVRFMHGLKDVEREPEFGTSQGLVRNRTFSLLASVRYRIAALR